MRTRWLSRFAFIFALASAAALGVSGPAWAVGTIPINPGNVPTTAEEFEKPATRDADCEDIADAIEEEFGDNVPDIDGFDGWHFILPGNTNDFTELNLVFKDGATTVNVTIPGTTADYVGWLTETGSGQVKHAYLLTSPGWELVGGTADVTGTVDSKSQFNLSHTCAGEGGGGGSESPSTPGTPSESESTPGGGGGGGSELPTTGAAVGGIALVGVALVGAGVGLLVLRRRRDRFVA